MDGLMEEERGMEGSLLEMAVASDGQTEGGRAACWGDGTHWAVRDAGLKPSGLSRVEP